MTNHMGHATVEPWSPMGHVMANHESYYSADMMQSWSNMGHAMVNHGLCHGRPWVMPRPTTGHGSCHGQSWLMPWSSHDHAMVHPWQPWSPMVWIMPWAMPWSTMGHATVAHGRTMANTGMPCHGHGHLMVEPWSPIGFAMATHGTMMVMTMA